MTEILVPIFSTNDIHSVLLGESYNCHIKIFTLRDSECASVVSRDKIMNLPQI